MFCRKCGKTLLDGDRFCSYCGAQVIERKENEEVDENEEEVVYNNGMASEILTENRLESVVAQENVLKACDDETCDDENSKDVAKQPIPNWNLEGFPLQGEQHKKTEEIKVDWENQEPLKFETTFENCKDTESALEDNVKTDSEMKIESEMGIFEPFNKQQQKDEELEENKRFINPTLEQELFGDKNNKSNNIHTLEEEQIDKFYTFSKKNEEFQKLLDKEYERLKQTPEFIAPEVNKISNIKENVKIENEFENGTEEKEPPQKHIEDDNEKYIEPIVEKSIIEDNNSKTIYKETLISENVDDSKENAKECSNSEPIEKSTEEQKEENLEANTSKDIEMDIKEKEKTDFSVLPWDEEENQLGEFTNEDTGKKISPMFIILSIIIVILTFEIIILGIKFFLPESSAAAFVNDKLAVTVSWVDSLSRNDKNQEEQKKLDTQEEIDKDEEQNQEVEEVNTIPQPNPEPNLDKTALVTEAIAYNTNIKSITADDSLAYIENKNYRDKNINNSKIIENNIWYQDENGNTVYYDKEIVKTIIQFDSAWIDYVNKKDSTVLDLTKEGSSAYKNAKNFSKIGKITESFDSLKIGEIRQNKNGFFVWANESITTTEAGKNSTDTHNWVYYLEPVDKQMKVVSYTTF